MEAQLVATRSDKWRGEHRLRGHSAVRVFPRDHREIHSVRAGALTVSHTVAKHSLLRTVDGLWVSCGTPTDLRHRPIRLYAYRHLSALTPAASPPAEAAS